MPKSNIAFANLRAEMGRKNLSTKDISTKTGISQQTLGAKLSRRSPLYLGEAFKIRNLVFPDQEISYLFSELTDCLNHPNALDIPPAPHDEPV